MKLTVITTGKVPAGLEAQELEITGLKILEKCKLEGEFVIDLSFATENEIAQLNQKHRKINKPTDVLSFPIFEKFPKMKNNEEFQGQQPFLLGSIVIAPDFVSKSGYKIKPRVKILFGHGLRHLLGYHHKSK